MSACSKVHHRHHYYYYFYYFYYYYYYYNYYYYYYGYYDYYYCHTAICTRPQLKRPLPRLTLLTSAPEVIVLTPSEEANDLRRPREP